MTLSPTSNVTCLLTSCGRQDLLAVTLETFFKFNTYPIKEFWIYEDSGIAGINDELKLLYPFINWIEPAERMGQIVALDTLWSKCSTEYAFTMEDDWETYRSGFIEDSKEILEQHKTIGQVWLRERNEANGHPVQWLDNHAFGIMKTNHGLWTGLCFNPSLKRKADYDLITSYGRHAQFLRKAPWKAESTIGKLYNSLGFKAAMLPHGYIKHIGDQRHVS